MQASSATRDGDDETRRKARRGLAVYFAVVVALSAPTKAMIIAADLEGGEKGVVAWLILMTALMSVQIIVSVVARVRRTRIHPPTRRAHRP